MCHHTSLVTVVSAALGGSSSKSEEEVVDVTRDALSFEHALSNMNAILNWG